MSKEIPILFSTPMVQAIFKDRKTMTRRILKCKHKFSFAGDGKGGMRPIHTKTYEPIKCPYGQVGDILWVRETWNMYNEKFYGLPDKKVFLYKADGTDRTCTWKPSIFMPKEACRLKLLITNITVEPLHDIIPDDAIAEGIHFDKDSGYWFADDLAMAHTPIACFQELWIKINGKKSWNKNPWVWVITFKKIK